MPKWFVIWDDETKQLGAASAFSRSWISDLFSAPFWDNIPDKPFAGLGNEFSTDTSGNLQIAGLDASKIASGVLDVARIPDLDASKITSGVFDLARIPNIDWSRISGNFPRDISDLISSAFSRSWISDLFSAPFWDNIPDKPSTFPPEAHTHPRSDITDFWAAPFWSNIPDKPSMHRGFNYIVYEENGTIKAIDGRTGETLTEGTDPSAVINYVFQNMSNGESVAIVGDFTINSPLQLVDKNHVKIFQWGTLTAGDSLIDDYMIKITQPSAGYGARFNKLFIDKLQGNGNCHGILLQNVYNNEIFLGEIDNVVKGITLAGYNGWSESNKIRGGQVRATQYCIGAEVLAGESTSIVNTTLDSVALGVYQYGVYIPSNVMATGSVFNKLHGWANADGATMFYLCGTIKRSTIISPWFEDAQGQYSNTKMFHIEASDFVIINPNANQIDTVYDIPGNSPFIVIDAMRIYFANKAPAMYGGIGNIQNSQFRGWYLYQDSDCVLNVYPQGRTNPLYKWVEEGTWKNIFQIYGDGRIEVDTLEANNDLRLPTTQPSNPVAGSMYFDPSTDKLYIYDGSTWKSVTLT